MAETGTIRPTKKQQELLNYIETFIGQYGYSPSYREIMKGLNYTSVATVSLHVNSLISRGHLKKRDRSARSLEVVKASPQASDKISPKQLNASEEKWLVDKVELFFKEAEDLPRAEQAQLDQLYVLVGALKVLGLTGAASSYSARLSVLKKPATETEYAV
ncbi:MAG TPA: hypothetical protein VFP35_02400 [Candidatus Saccharimonadales bacterium]|nr:hypothetical protein [Candidatus Saccharimonadales bacterium]